MKKEPKIKKLKKEILQHLSKKLGKKENIVQVRISETRRKYPALTLNAAAHIYAQKNGISILNKLDSEDRASLSTVGTKQEQSTPIVLRAGQKKPVFIMFFKYETKDRFQKRHIDEINKAYNCGCYTAVFILCRKVIENLVIDLLIKQFPESNKKNRELYFNTSQGRFHDFSVILDNLHKKRTSFPSSAKKPIERLHNRAKPFAKDANDKTHSWFHVAGKKELDDMNAQEIVDLIQKIDEIISQK